jgi:hypothetical protein
LTTPAQREDKFSSKYVAATVSLKVASQLSTMKGGFASIAGMSDLVAKEQLIQSALNAITPSVPTIHYPYYLNFGREIWRLTKRGISGPAMADSAHNLKTKYIAYGLIGATLDAVAAIFSLTGL